MDMAAVESKQNLVKNPKRFGTPLLRLDRRCPEMDKFVIVGIVSSLTCESVLGKLEEAGSVESGSVEAGSVEADSVLPR